MDHLWTPNLCALSWLRLNLSIHIFPLSKFFQSSFFQVVKNPFATAAAYTAAIAIAISIIKGKR